MTGNELIDSPEWHWFGNEAALATDLVATGVTALGKASHSQRGLYYTALFGLSLGLERTAKIVILADAIVRDNGRLPTNKFLRDLGHDVHKLLMLCEEISRRWGGYKEYAERPNSPIHDEIVHVLTDFAKTARYFNLNSLTGQLPQHTEPVERWWTRVGGRILELHYSRRVREQDEIRARFVDELTRDIVHVLHSDEEGREMNTMRALMLRAGATRIVQRYGRLYVLQIMRWLTRPIFEIARVGGYERRINAVFGLDEPFRMFLSDDKYLLGRKTWLGHR